MRATVRRNLSAQWTEALSLTRRRAPELYHAGTGVEPGPYADAIQLALDELQLAAVFCIEGVPTVGFLNDPDISQQRIDMVHRILWNQGLMSLLLVIKVDEVIAYSLAQRPFIDTLTTGTDPRIISTFSLVSHALQLRQLIESTESGRFWFEHDRFFDPANRVDSVLLANLLQAFRELKDELGNDASQALLMQAMFISYLEDRKIIKPDVFRNASGNQCSSFAEMLSTRSTAPLEALFVWLKEAFNGNVFNAPCAFDVNEVRPPRLKTSHLKVLARFRHGKEEMASGQLRLWGYDFQYMPIALISAVYDRFLKEEADTQNADGAFYTPMFLADMVVNQMWDELSDEQRAAGTFCDPACGSGIFLVRLFQRLVAHHCRLKKKQRATWNELIAIARRLHGGDINASAVRVAAFSLYIALLEQSNPPDLQVLIEKKKKLLPPLYGDTLRPAEDFFETPDGPRFDAIVGNPPWKGRSGQITSAHRWAVAHNRPDPAKDIAWSFIWKSLDAVKPCGLIGLLVPAMGILHNTTTSAEARRELVESARIMRIINLSDLCFQLFDGAQRPTAFVMYQRAVSESVAYKFEYWTPKADLNLRLKRMMALTRSDRCYLRSDQVSADPAIFKRRLWTRPPDEKLLQYLRSVSPLSAIVKQYKDLSEGEFDRNIMWVVGQGFQPAQPGKTYRTTSSADVVKYPYFAATNFSPLAIPTISAKPWRTKTVRRAGFSAGFEGPHILIPQGIERAAPRLRAAYAEQSLTFEDSLQGIVFPPTQRATAKLLTAVLNSRLAAWFYFHETSNLGTDRAKVHQNDLVKLPFAQPKDMPDPDKARTAAQKLVRLVDGAIKHADDALRRQDDALGEIDSLVYEYYGLDDQDIALVEDSFSYIIPAMQPRRSAGIQAIWRTAKPEQRSSYSVMLCEALKPWFKRSVSASLAAKSADIAVLRLSLNGASRPKMYREDPANDLDLVLNRIASNMPVALPGNVQLVPDLRVIIGEDIYLVKPLQLRHWLRSAALADAEQIAAEFSAAIARTRDAHAAG